jgi:hypothetical protein
MESFIWEQIRYSHCSKNEYYRIYIYFLINEHKTLIQKSLNKRIYSKEDAFGYIQKLIKKYGDPFPPTDLSNRKKIIYSPNYRGVTMSI